MSAVPAARLAGTTEARALVDLARALTVVVTDVHSVGARATTRIAELLGDQVSLGLIPADGSEPTCVGTAYHPPGPDRPATRDAQALGHRPAPPRTAPVLGRRAHRTAVTRVLASGRPLVLGTAESSPYGASGVAMLPVQIQGRNAGVLMLSRDPGRPPYSEPEIEFGEALAGIVGVVLDAARMLGNSTAALEDLQQQNEVIDTVSDAIIACDESCAIVDWSRAAERMYLYEEGDALSCDLFTLLGTEFFTLDGHPMTRDEVLGAVRENGSWHGALRERRADGARIETITSLTALNGLDHDRSGVVAVNRDVTEQRHKEYQASHDPLTGLPNRRGLSEALQRAIGRGREHGTALGVLFFDLDRFKPINDTLGHKAGDEVLCMVAKRIAAALRRGDSVTRLGGDEFVAIAENLADAEDAAVLARRLLAAVSQPIVLAGQTISVTASVGIVVTDAPPGDSVLPDQLVRAADSAMYEAKQSRAGVAFAA